MKSDLEKLQGAWQLIEFEMDGRKIPPGSASVVIEGDQFTSLSMGAEYAGAMVVDAAGKPKTFDVKFHKGPHKGQTSLGIYELKGKTWKICIGLAGVKRPTRFAAEPGTGHALETLIRAAATPQKTPAEPGKSTGKPVPELEGEWFMLSCLQDGKPMDAKIRAAARRVFQGDQTTMFVFDQVYMKSRFTVARAGTIDYLDTHQLGIYEVTGKILKTCLAAARKPRPKDFTATPGDGRTVSEWSRKKK